MSRVPRKHDDLSERDLKIVEMRDIGKYKLREIAETFGISRQRVLQICDREGCRKLRLGTTNLTYDERKLIVAMYNEGHGIIELGRKFNRSPSTIRAIWVAAGVRIGQRGPVTNRREQTEREGQIVTLYSEGGHTQTELAKMFNTTQASISRIIHRRPRK